MALSWQQNVRLAQEQGFFFLFLMKSGDVVLSSWLFVSFGVSSFRDTYRDEFAVPRGAPGGAAPVRGEIPLPGALATSTPHSPGREGLRGSCPHPLFPCVTAWALGAFAGPDEPEHSSPVPFHLSAWKMPVQTPPRTRLRDKLFD